MEYIKVHIDEMFQKFVFFEYRLIEEDKSNDMVSRAFPFAKLIDREPKIEQLVEGTIVGINSNGAVVEFENLMGKLTKKEIPFDDLTKIER